MMVSGSAVALSHIRKQAVSVRLIVHPRSGRGMCGGFTLHFTRGRGFRARLDFHPCRSMLGVSEGFSKARQTLIRREEYLMGKSTGRLGLHIVLSEFDTRMFVGSNRRIVSTIVFARRRTGKVSFFTSNTTGVSMIGCSLM